MQFETHHYELLIREKHLDSFGHVNNATYLEIFEEARWQLITERGYGFDKVHELQIGPTILEIQLRFHKEVKLRQKVVIETKMESYAGKIGEIAQVLKDAKTGDAHCTARFKTALLDMKARKLIPPTPEWLHAVGMM